MEEKNTNVSQTEENPEQNSPEISAESESITEAAKDGVKTAVPKWLIVIIAAMAAVIIGLSVTLAVILAGGKPSMNLHHRRAAHPQITAKTHHYPKARRAILRQTARRAL